MNQPLPRDDVGLQSPARSMADAILMRAAALGCGLVAACLGFASIGLPSWTTTFGLAAAGAGILIHFGREQRLRGRIAVLEERLEDMADRQWEHREAEERARTLLEVQGDLVVRRDGFGRITYANDTFAQMAGRAPHALRGECFSPHVVEQGDVTIVADGTRLHDQTIKTPHGPRVIAWRDVTVHAHDAIEIQSVGRDVTERAAAGRAMVQARDQANAANHAKGQFLATVSHEIRTPLNGILGMTDLLLDTPLTAEQTTYARAVKASGDALLTLIGGVLDLSKAEAGRLDVATLPFTLASMVEEVVELLSPRAHAKGLDIGSHIDPRLPGRVRGDAVRLRQVLLNLAGNAVKFTERGAIAVLVTGGPDDVVKIAITDTGIGIALDAQSRIFEEFEQADPLSVGTPSGDAAGGTGLGLAISKSIVERLGGDITVESAPGRGATFTVTLPLPAAEAEPTADALSLRAAQVLLVGAMAGHAPLLAQTLGAWDAKTCVASDDAVAHALLPERPWDAMVVDCAIGATRAQALASAGRGIARRIVLLSPSERHELPALKAAGFTSYLIKPVRSASLKAMFDETLMDVVTEPSLDHAGVPETPAKVADGLSVLVAEDNEINALLARALLVKLGHRPAMASDGDAAVAAWRAARTAGQPFDLVLMDLQMPGMDGLSAAREIRTIEIEIGARATPIFALTANAAEEDRDRCLAAGMDGFLEKPLKRERLEDLLTTKPAGATRAA